MASIWTTPRTWSAEVATPTHFNDHVSKNFLAIRHVKSLATEGIVVNNSTAFENLTGLSFKVRDGETWTFEATVYFVTNAAADAKFTVIAPTGSVGRFGVLHNGVTNLSFTNVFGDPITLSVAGTDEETATVMGLVAVVADGVVQIQGSQLAATVVNTTFYAESAIQAHRRDI